MLSFARWGGSVGMKPCPGKDQFPLQAVSEKARGTLWPVSMPKSLALRLFPIYRWRSGDAVTRRLKFSKLRLNRGTNVHSLDISDGCLQLIDSALQLSLTRSFADAAWSRADGLFPFTRTSFQKAQVTAGRFDVCPESRDKCGRVMHALPSVKTF